MPQLENGYIKIANELFDALIKFKLPGNELRIALFVIRKTYGFNKKSDWISNSQFVLGTGINKSNVCRAINNLILKKIVDKDDNSKTPSYRFNKNYWQWEQVTTVTTKPLLSKMNTTVVTDDNTTSVDPTDNENQPTDCSNDQNQDSEQLSSVTTIENDLLSPLSNTKDSNNVTKDRGPAESGQAKTKEKNISAKLKKLSAIAAGNFDPSLVGDYAFIGETFPDMQIRAKKELEELKRKMK